MEIGYWYFYDLFCFIIVETLRSNIQQIVAGISSMEIEMKHIEGTLFLNTEARVISK